MCIVGNRVHLDSYQGGVNLIWDQYVFMLIAYFLKGAQA
jgi:hypothetical protein